MFMESVVPSRAAATAATFGIRIFLQVCQSFIAVFEELAQTIFERRCIVEAILTFMIVIERFSRCRCFFRRSRRFQCFDRKTDLAALWPEADRVSALHDANDVCLVLQADIAGVTMLLASDLPGVYEKYISVPADVLKVAHHGSADSTTPEFLAAVDPQILLLSNRLESRELRMAEAAGKIPLYTTEKHGGITIRFLGDGAYTVDTVTK